MDFLRLLVFFAAWGLMWRWVVKSRGSWNLFFGNLVGVAGGFIVAMVLLAITFSLFPDKTPARPIEADAQTSQQSSPVTDTQVSAPEEPAAVAVKPILPPAPVATPAPVTAAEVVAAAPTDAARKTEPPESALLPDYRARSQKTLSENLIVKDFNDTDRAVIDAKRQAAGTGADADRSNMAVVMCIPPLQEALRFPSTERVIGPPFKATRQHDQIYNVTAVISADNMLAATVAYRYSCSVQAVPGAGDTEWKLVDLNLTPTSR